MMASYVSATVFLPIVVSGDKISFTTGIPKVEVLSQCSPNILNKSKCAKARTVNASPLISLRNSSDNKGSLILSILVII